MGQTVPRMNPVQARAWMALVSAAELLPQTLDAQLTADAGLINFEYGVLGMLNVAPDCTLRSGELAAALGAPAPRLSKAVSRLEKRGLVERVACAGDGRAINVHLTRDGRRAWLKATPSHIALARDTLLGDLTAEQLTSLAQLLEMILTRLDPEHTVGVVPEREQLSEVR
ncbi:MarR family winged helix-turn-helix transcriptional regulator [Humibacter antri]